MIVWGGWNGHDPEECAAIYRRWLHEDGFMVRVESDMAVFGDPAIHDLSLIVPICTMSKLATEHARNFASAVEGGVGVGGHHGGMSDAFREAVEYQFVIGGQWVAHPGDIIDYTVDVAKPDDPIMQGLPASFPYHSEQYYMHVDPSVEVLATTTFSGEHAPWTKGVVMPVAWKRQYGKGRVFHSTLGHRASEFEIPQMATMLRRGINWAAREEAAGGRQ
jgi:type 1 glutamine amidotransferase